MARGEQVPPAAAPPSPGKGMYSEAVRDAVRTGSRVVTRDGSAKGSPAKALPVVRARHGAARLHAWRPPALTRRVLRAAAPQLLWPEDELGTLTQSETQPVEEQLVASASASVRPPVPPALTAQVRALRAPPPPPPPPRALTAADRGRCHAQLSALMATVLNAADQESGAEVRRARGRRGRARTR
jgi:hypothetical protein